jgi:hypothetical protein
MSGAATPSRWARISDAELQLLLDALRTTPHSRAYEAAMYGPGVAERLAEDIARELTARGYKHP